MRVPWDAFGVRDVGRLGASLRWGSTARWFGCALCCHSLGPLPDDPADGTCAFPAGGRRGVLWRAWWPGVTRP